MTHNLDLPKVQKMRSLGKSAFKSSHLRSNHNSAPKTNNYKCNFFFHSIKNAKPIIGRIKRNCKTTQKPKIIFSRPRIEKIREKINESKHEFSKSKINEIRRNLFERKSKKNFSAPKIKEI